MSGITMDFTPVIGQQTREEYQNVKTQTPCLWEQLKTAMAHIGGDRRLYLPEDLDPLAQPDPPFSYSMYESPHPRRQESSKHKQTIGPQKVMTSVLERDDSDFENDESEDESLDYVTRCRIRDSQSKPVESCPPDTRYKKKVDNSKHQQMSGPKKGMSSRNHCTKPVQRSNTSTSIPSVDLQRVSIQKRKSPITILKRNKSTLTSNPSPDLSQHQSHQEGSRCYDKHLSNSPKQDGAEASPPGVIKFSDQKFQQLFQNSSPYSSGTKNQPDGYCGYHPHHNRQYHNHPVNTRHHYRYQHPKQPHYRNHHHHHAMDTPRSHGNHRSQQSYHSNQHQGQNHYYYNHYDYHRRYQRPLHQLNRQPLVSY